MNDSLTEIDVLCVGHASYDLVFSVPHHPSEDEKMFARGFTGCGGGPAANAAVGVSRLGLKSAYAGYLGNDLYGEKHLEELLEQGVDTRLVVTGPAPTPISAVLVKPDGTRALINYKSDTRPLAAGDLDFSVISPRAVLFDGHEPHVSVVYCHQLRKQRIPTVLDAGSLHEGTQALMGLVDYLVCSEKFALQIAESVDLALTRLAAIAPAVVITLSERGLRWRMGERQGSLPAFSVDSIDSTGAGDAFHGAFAAALSLGMEWANILLYASAAGALCCTKIGARTGLPFKEEHSTLLKSAAASNEQAIRTAGP
ncbi:MAG: carbohydrate kinase family protein [Gammaproteobacteria bacterium]